MKVSSVKSDDNIYEDRMVPVLISLIICVNLDVKIDWRVFINDVHSSKENTAHVPLVPKGAGSSKTCPFFW